MANNGGWMDGFQIGGGDIGQMDWIRKGRPINVGWVKLTNCEMRVSNYDLLISKHTRSAEPQN